MKYELQSVLDIGNPADSTIVAHTPSVARDMLSIIDAWDEWRESTFADQTLIPIEKKKEIHTISDVAQPIESRGKLVFWGFSYGVRCPLLPPLSIFPGWEVCMRH